ncbi:MAG TPA: serine hydrolase domain-containing protein [Caulobacteraceae bacterium]|nr:serine hydrolase domain-containing protein [Caulobacteraceae bacterium]
MADGVVAAGFERVRDAFAEDQKIDPGGAQLCVYRDGRMVVDLWTGHDSANSRPFTGDTITVLMSCTKAVVAICAHMLVERGQLDLDTPVVRYWPEFAQGGKEAVTLAQLLSHSCGLAGVDPSAGIDAPAMLDWDRCVHALAAMRPLWAPGTAYMYHFITYGWLVGEVIRRVTGKTVGAFLADEIARPLSLDLWIGLPADQQHRVAPHFRTNPAFEREALTAFFKAQGFDPGQRLLSTMIDTMVATDALIEAMNTAPYRAAEVPAGNGIGNARSLARLYAAAIGPVDGIRLLSFETLDRARRPQTDHLKGPHPFDGPVAGGSPQRFGLGFELPRSILPMLGEGSFGHPGAGGRVAYAHPEKGIAVAYVCNNLLWNGQTADPRWTGWSEALREIAGA